ncbi:MAG: aspartate aminotransferase family protein [Acidobacteriota bacterium]
MKISNAPSVVELEDRYQLNVYAKLPLVVDRGEGCYVFDQQGRRFLDLYAGHAVTSTGHCHPKVVDAVSRQLRELIFYSNATYSTVRGRALEKLIQFCEPYHQAFLVNSGAEANENAIKLARALTGRSEVISCQGSFHGRTYGSLSATGISHYREYLNTPVPSHRVLPASSIPEQISETTAAVLVEPIQSMGGVVVIPVEVLQAIEQACRNKGALLIFDEIQTGVGRTGGTFLYSQKIGVRPDLTSLAKGIASGYPAAALLVSSELASQVNKGDLGSTFGGNPAACAAILATLSVLEEENLLENVTEVSHYLSQQLAAVPRLKEVRGEGFLIGISLHGQTAKAVQKSLFEQGILAGTSYDPEVLRLMPALTLGRAEVDRFVGGMLSI